MLARSGRDVRAIYGRTIAKSASGHRLGLASPLNQKDKIKGRLKMLGQSEKSTLRRRLGAGLVAVGTVVALPLTATVTYAEAVDPVEALVPEAPLTPAAPAAPKAPSAVSAPPAPLAPAGPEAAGDVTNITMLNGREDYDPADDHVHTIRHNGRTIIIRTDKKLSEREIRQMVEEAEQSRREAEQAVRESEWEQKEMGSVMSEVDRELAEAKREIEREMRDAAREVRQAEREARQARREAMRDAREAQREARQAARDARREAQATASSFAISYSTSNKVSGPDCEAMNKQIAMGGKNGLGGQAWAVVAGCGGFDVKIDKTAILKTALSGLEKSRAEAAKCEDKDADSIRKIREMDRSIEKVKAQLSMT